MIVISVCVRPHESQINYFLLDIQPLRYRALIVDDLIC